MYFQYSQISNNFFCKKFFIKKIKKKYRY